MKKFLTILAILVFVGASCNSNRETANDWKTLDNSQYGYTVQYPPNWFVDTTYNEQEYTPRGEEGVMVGGDTYYSNYDNPSQYDAQTIPTDFQALTFMVVQVNPDITYDNFFAENQLTTGTKENIKINDRDAIKLTDITVAEPAGITVVNTFLKDGDRMFVFNYSGNPIPEEIEDTFEQIIQSFKIK